MPSNTFPPSSPAAVVSAPQETPRAEKPRRPLTERFFEVPRTVRYPLAALAAYAPLIGIYSALGPDAMGLTLLGYLVAGAGYAVARATA